MSNIVAIVGRPNVGKSTLFNRLIGGRKAIVKEVSGVTRDRHYGKSEWNGKKYSVIDTGGYVSGSEDIFEGEIRRQVEIAINEANVIVFVVDVETGITDLDHAVANILRRAKKSVIVVANKVDNHDRINDTLSSISLVLNTFLELVLLMVLNRRALDHLATQLDHEGVEVQSEIPRIAIVGKPNVGKSSLTNSLLEKIEI